MPTYLTVVEWERRGAAIRAAIRDGALTLAEIGARAGLTAGAARRTCIELGIHYPGRCHARAEEAHAHRRKWNRAELAAVIEEEGSFSAAADRLGISRQRVSQLAGGFGIPSPGRCRTKLGPRWPQHLALYERDPKAARAACGTPGRYRSMHSLWYALRQARGTAGKRRWRPVTSVLDYMVLGRLWRQGVPGPELAAARGESYRMLFRRIHRGRTRYGYERFPRRRRPGRI